MLVERCTATPMKTMLPCKPRCGDAVGLPWLKLSVCIFNIYTVWLVWRLNKLYQTFTAETVRTLLSPPANTDLICTAATAKRATTFTYLVASDSFTISRVGKLHLGISIESLPAQHSHCTGKSPLSNSTIGRTSLSSLVAEARVAIQSSAAQPRND